MIKQARVLVRGDVIGVGFRAWTKYQSKFVNVQGCVSIANDDVVVLLEGEEIDVKNMIEKI
mgnify:CR=1 FL=1